MTGQLAVMTFLGVVLAAPAPAKDSYDAHTFFDNSITGDFYFYSRGSAVAPSTLERIRGKCPVDTSQFFLPPNSLRLSWLSRTGGHWEMEILPARWRNRDISFDGDTLSLWLYSPEHLDSLSLPAISIMDQEGARSGALVLSEFAGSLRAGEWRWVLIPFSSFSLRVDRTQLKSISFVQNGADGRRHTLLVDEVRVISAGHSAPLSLAAPYTVKAEGYERHIEVSWNADGSPTLVAFLIERSEDGSRFHPLGIQRSALFRYMDYVGNDRRTMRYRICAVDETYRQSPCSDTAIASTRAMTDDELLSMVQRAAFLYYWDNGHPVSGLARENTPGDPDLVTTGASGFGIMSIVVGVSRNFITREAGAERILKCVQFLAHADRFHGAWPHFMNGATGKVIPLFGKYDDGGDLVETAFLVQGLLTARQFFDRNNDTEAQIRATISLLWESVGWDWYRRDTTSDFLFWHWSPDYEWHINHPLVGWNETMIVYILAIASPTHPVPPQLYYRGWAGTSDRAIQYRRNWSRTDEGDHYANGDTYYGMKLDIGCGRGGPLFFTHYSFLGLDPRGLRDRFTDYFVNNRNQSLINRAYCMENPGHYAGYGPASWGLTASDDPHGYLAHEPEPDRDNGTITPTGALGSFPYTPEESMAALEHFYRDLGRELWDVHGFRDAFNETENWYAPIFTALDEGPIAVMIENYRTALCWKMFMANPEIPRALAAIGLVRGHEGGQR